MPWRCHRSLIAHAFVVHGVRVEEIVSETKLREHALTGLARVDGTVIACPPLGTLFLNL
jgi:uncharacterized protein (DUF488 family)